MNRRTLAMERIATALEDIADQLRYQNERAFPPIPEPKTDPKKVVFTRRKRDATQEG